MTRKTGIYETLGNITFFIPNPLPPRDPPLILDEKMLALYGEAMLQLGKINEMTKRLASIHYFIRAYINKEAQLSSAIENIHTTLPDIFTQSIEKVRPDKNTQLVMNYTKALSQAIAMMQKENLPIASRIILATHKTLMQIGEGDKADPGNYRKQIVKVGRLIPPPASKVPELMAKLETYINTDETLPPLIKAGLAHVQFETIHPFLDGNGRIGRLLIVLMLIESGILLESIIYPSYYFKKRHYDYYKYLNDVRTTGNFETWITYYLSVIRDSSIDAYQRARDIEKLHNNSIQIISDTRYIKTKARETRLQAIDIIFNYPVINIKKLSQELGVSYNTANSIIAEFIQLGFLRKEKRQKRSKLFMFKPYFEILERDYNI